MELRGTVLRKDVMVTFRRAYVGVFVAGLCGVEAAQQQVKSGAVPSAEEVMARVAANQDRAEQGRTHYVYTQHARVISRKGNKVMCEEITDARITPSPDGSHTELLKLEGRVLHKHSYVNYSTLRATDKEVIPAQDLEKTGNDVITINLDDGGLDRGLVESMRVDLTRSGSKDGIDGRLFPLTSRAQSSYLFQLIGPDRMNGRDVYHLTFHPKDKDSYDWRGDAYIDKTAYQPVVVTTTIARNIPFAVRTLLGTNLPGLGFSINYAPQPDGVWFPVSFGTEFKVKVLFFFHREIIIDAHNSSFEKTHVTTRIVEGSAP